AEVVADVAVLVGVLVELDLAVGDLVARLPVEQPHVGVAAGTGRRVRVEVHVPVAVGVDPGVGAGLVLRQVGLPGAADVDPDGGVPVVAELGARALGRGGLAGAVVVLGQGDEGDAEHEGRHDEDDEALAAPPGLRLDLPLVPRRLTHTGEATSGRRPGDGGPWPTPPGRSGTRRPAGAAPAWGR